MIQLHFMMVVSQPEIFSYVSKVNQSDRLVDTAEIAICNDEDKSWLSSRSETLGQACLLNDGASNNDNS